MEYKWSLSNCTRVAKKRYMSVPSYHLGSTDQIMNFFGEATVSVYRDYHRLILFTGRPSISMTVACFTRTGLTPTSASPSVMWMPVTELSGYAIDCQRCRIWPSSKSSDKFRRRIMSWLEMSEMPDHLPTIVKRAYRQHGTRGIENLFM